MQPLWPRVYIMSVYQSIEVNVSISRGFYKDNMQ